MEERNGYFFESSLFEIEVGEDEETNPAIYGKALAHWLAEKFKSIGYNDAEAGPEDWGWSVTCLSKPYHIFIACSSFVDHDKEYDENNPPKGSDVVWQCFLGVDRPFIRNPFKKLDTSKEVEIGKNLFDLLDSTEEIIKTDEP